MGMYSIIGGKPLEGELKIQGSKNAVLPILAATILIKGKSYLYNCPRIIDVDNMIKILEAIGCICIWQEDVLIVDAASIHTDIIPDNFVQTMRSSIIVMGSMLGRLRSVVISFPGGCSIGVRPIDLHIKALKQMNIDIEDTGGFLKCSTPEIRGNMIHLDYPSVGATENIMLAAVLSTGITRIYNPAKEPEIIELGSFLNAAGAKISGVGTDCVTIEGVKALKEVHYHIVPDRIVAGTFLAAAAISGGEIILRHCYREHIDAICSKISEMGCTLRWNEDHLFLKNKRPLKAINLIRTQPHPGFPTDMQAQIMACLTIAEGTSVISETIFESRFKHVPQLSKMGADIIIEGRLAIIKGVKGLVGADVYAEDLRGGAALVIAGLAAEGITNVHNTGHIFRGYEDLHGKLNLLGAQINYLEDER